MLLIGFGVLATAAAVTLIGSGIGAAFAYRQVTKGLPSVAQIGNEHLAESSIIYDRHGTELFRIVDPELGVRTSVPLSEVSPYLIWATVSTENPTFFTDPGVDIASIARATFQDLSSGRTLSGASTITQQLVKNTVLGNQISITRKIKEAILAYRLTKELPKSRILELYLNSIFYGNNRYGVEAASEEYFNKPAKDLDLAQAALLAGLPQSPSYYDPFTNFPAAKRRQKEVLQAMVRQQLITQQQADQAFAENVHLVNPSEHKTRLLAPHFVFYVINQLVQQFGYDEVYRGGLRVTTTLDYPLNQAAQQIVHDQIAKIQAIHHATDGALVAIDPRNGQILAMIGSADYQNQQIHGEVNVALAPRQPGSTVKGFTYAAAFERGYSPSSVIVDAKTDFPTSPAMINGTYRPSANSKIPVGYAPCNYDNQVAGCPPQYFHGSVTMREALGNSLNVPAVKTLQYAGIGNMIALARRMGITTWNKPVQDYGLSITLGGSEVTLLDLTSAYGVFADGGVRHPPVPWLDIHDIYGHVFYHDAPLHPDPGRQVLSPQVAYLITSVLSDDNARALEFGTHSGLVLSREAAAKTGTTDSFRDNWTVGYTPNLVTGVWVGNADNTPMQNVIGITGAGPIWHDFMETALRTLPVENFHPPPGMVQERVSDLTGLLPNSSGSQRIVYTLEPGTHFYFSNYVNIGEPSHVDWFIQGTEPRTHTYRLGTYEALWSTGQEAINCPPYMVDVRVYGPVPPPPGLYNCATGQVISTGGFQYTPGWDNPIIALPTATPKPTPKPVVTPKTKPSPTPTAKKP
ncbi:MAG: transglycosylase domain-containing protein [Chloroflexi bacterium]|nr:transglycosylase domain-containing protein [Chloroflexota bacterium]